MSTHTFNCPLSGTTRVSRYQKGKSNLDFTEARDSEWQWHQLDHMITHNCYCYISIVLYTEVLTDQVQGRRKQDEKYQKNTLEQVIMRKTGR